MKFCEKCQRCMIKYLDKKLMFECPSCKEMIEGTDEDARIFGDIFSSVSEINKNIKFIKNMHLDPVNEKVARKCKNCKDPLPYMVFGRFGPSETAILKCIICGQTEFTGDEKSK